MKPFDWNSEKSLWLERTRGISFEEVVCHINSPDLLDIVPHPRLDKYPNQKIFIVKVDDYIYMVPYVETDECYYLKTILPSRKATRKYLGDRSHGT